jgi:DNA-binding Lrp family transcriptional regulator
VNVTIVVTFGSRNNNAQPCLECIIVSGYTTNGRWDIVVELGVESLEAFDQALQRIRLIKGISTSETSLLLSTHKIYSRTQN